MDILPLSLVVTISCWPLCERERLVTVMARRGVGMCASIGPVVCDNRQRQPIFLLSKVY